MTTSKDDEQVREIVVVACANAAHVATMVASQLVFQLPREPAVNYIVQRNSHMNSILFNERKCRGNMRMGIDSFNRLCELLREQNLLEDTRNCQVEEMLMRFLHIIGHDQRHRVVEGTFYRSLETISRQFNETLDAVLQLYKPLVADHGESVHNGGTPPQVAHDNRFAKYFKDCLGALDGTHIHATVPQDEVERFRSGRKEFCSQNVLAACSFDLKFTYVLVGWEGTSHDQRVLDDARTRSNPFTIPEGKFYLADAGYAITRGILTPYRNTRYHLKEYAKNEPRNSKELYNKRHSTLRNVIERAFGVLKKRWPMLSSTSYYSFKTQVKIAMACFVLHNFIMGVDPNDPIVEEVEREFEANGVELDPPSSSNSGHSTYREDQAFWISFRERLATKMFDDYRQRRNV